MAATRGPSKSFPPTPAFSYSVTVNVKWGFLHTASRASNLKNDRLARLAKSLDALAAVDENAIEKAREISSVRRHAALELHAICGNFVRELNGLTTETVIEFDPLTYRAEHFRDDGVNLFQINIRGRILQIEFESTAESACTENFRVPYLLEGAVRCFNQQLLEKHIIEEHSIFYTLEKNRNVWRFFDQRTYRTGPVDGDYLASLMEHLI